MKNLWKPNSRIEQGVATVLIFLVTAFLMPIVDGIEFLEAIVVVLFIGSLIYVWATKSDEFKAEHERTRPEREEKARVREEKRVAKKEELALKAEEAKVPKCPRCGSTHITAQKKGFRFGRAIIGSVVTLGVGAVAGATGSRKIDLTCMSCGKRFKPKRR